jgi:NAD(P)-dependent dehydrogenase (short-subunit alcohol dehydrogenase family)
VSRTVLVTAGASGIGRAIAEVFAEAGDRVHVCDVAPQALDALRIERPEIITHQADVADPAAVARLFEALGDRLDVLVNNAGVGGPRAPIEDTDEGEWEHTVAVNLNGAFFVAKHAARLMKRAGTGAIVNVSTATVRTGLPLRSAYVASKHGLMGLTQNLARELGPFGIRVNAVLPGPIDNPRGRALVQRLADEQGKSFAEVEAQVLRYCSMRSWIDPREVGEVALFLASAAARHVTGQFIGVDGGVEWEE